MRSSGETRRAARTALSGNFGTAVVVSLISVMIASATSFLTGFISSILQIVTGLGSAYGYPDYAYDAETIVTSTFRISAVAVVFIAVYIGVALLSQLVNSNLSAGMANYHLNLASGRRSEISDLFSSFKCGFIKPFGIFWLIYFKTLLWVLAGYAPALVLIAVASFSFVYELAALGGICIFFSILFVILGVILGIIAGIRYSMAYFVLADNQNVGVRESVRISKNLMQGHKADYVILQLSFIGWAILAVFTCGIGTLFLTPYINTANAVFYCDLIGRPVVGDMAWYNMMQGGAYNPNGYNPNAYNSNAYNPNAYNPNGYNPGGYNPNGNGANGYNQSGYNGTPQPNYDPDITAEHKIVNPSAFEKAPEFEEVDISKIGAEENIPKQPEKTDGTDNPEQNI